MLASQVKALLCSVLTAFLTFSSFNSLGQVSVWTYHNDNRRSGLNTNETILNLSNVNSNTFGKLFSYAVDGFVYAQPLYLPGVEIPGRGSRNLLLIATEHNTVYAFDADNAGASGGLIWKTNLGPAAVTTIAGVYTNKNFGTRYNNNAFTDIVPEVGITGTPVIDLSSGTLYVDAFTGEVGSGVTNYFHRLHALNITNGTQRSFSPVVVAASVLGIGVDSTNGRVAFNAKQHNQRCALTLAGGIVYLSYAGYADTNPYHGWIIGYNATNLVQLTNYVFNTTPNSTVAAYGANAGEGGIWMAGGGLSVDENTNLLFEVGNGIFNATNNSGGTEYGDSFVKLSTTNGLAVADYFTPYNQATLQANDTDLGSGGLLLLPDQPGPFPHLLVGAGKEGKIYLLNRDQFTTGNNHYNSTSTVDFVVQSIANKIGSSFGTPTFFNGRVYYASRGDNLKAFALTNGLLSTTDVLTNTARTFLFPGATPSISANGASGAIVWALRMGTPQLLIACNATNFTTELYNSGQAVGNRDQLGSGVKFAAQVVADGKVFVGSSNSVSVFGLLGGMFAFSSPTYRVAESNLTATLTVNRLGGTNGVVQVSYATVAGGTASNGVDYTSVAGTLTWTNGESSAKTFTVPILNDALAEPDETVDLALSTPTGGAALGLSTTAVLTILEPPTSVWKRAHFGTNANDLAVAGDLADPDQDGGLNLLEYAYASDPNSANSNSFTGSLVGQAFQLRFPRNLSASDLTYIVETSSTLQSWNNVMTFTATSGWVTNQFGTTVSELSSNGVAPNQFVNVTLIVSTNVTSPSLTNQFLRLEIHR